MSLWVRYCLEVVGWDGQPVPEGAPPEEWADPLLVQYCGRLETEHAYRDDELTKAFEEEWTCPRLRRHKVRVHRVAEDVVGAEE
jgi:hypothetical protein